MLKYRELRAAAFPILDRWLARHKSGRPAGSVTHRVPGRRQEETGVR